jgi:hypothetical protein
MAKQPQQTEAEIETEENTGSMVDMSGVDAAKQYENVPPGVYPVEIEELEFGQSQSKGNNMWTIRLRITEGEQENRVLYYFAVFTEGGIPRAKRFLLCLNNEQAHQLAEGSFDPEKVADEGTLIGAQCRIKVKLRRDRETREMRSNIAEILPLDADDLDFATS